MRILHIIKVWLIIYFITISASAKQVVESIVAVVNNEIITLTDITDYRNKLETGGLVDDALLNLTPAETLLKDRDRLIHHLIDERIIDSEVRRLNLNVTIERVEQEIRSITGRNQITRNQLREALKERGVSFAEYQDFIKSTLERQSLIEREVAPKIRITDEEILSYYAQKRESGGQIYQYTLAHILFLPRGGNVEEAQQRAESVLTRLKSGQASFEKLAEEYSEDPNFRDGGLLGRFQAGETLPEIESAVKDLPPGEISHVVRTRVGFHIIKVKERTLVADPQFERQKEQIHNALYAEAFKKQLRSWLDQQREDAFIRIN